MPFLEYTILSGLLIAGYIKLLRKKRSERVVVPQLRASDSSVVVAQLSRERARAAALRRGRERVWEDRRTERMLMRMAEMEALVTCPICYDEFRRLKMVRQVTCRTVGGPRGGGLDVCGHVAVCCRSCIVDFVRHQLADAALITPAGLPCIDSTCRVPLKVEEIAKFEYTSPYLAPREVGRCVGLFYAADLTLASRR